MPPDAVMAGRQAPVPGALGIPAEWRLPLLQLGLAWLALIGWAWRDWADMAGQWWHSSTYSHVLLVPLILAWLIKLRARELTRLVPVAWWPGLVFLFGALLIWLLGSVSGLNLARQLGAVLALQAAVLLLLGPRVAAGLLFPLAYMLFLVPFGDALIPALQMVTAKIAIALTHWSGVPAQIDGVFINTPVGLFEVAEACSGVKFLIAMLALSILIAQVCFVTWPRRVAFLGAAMVLPILANGVRAWGTIYIAQSQGIEFAAGFDHIVYGWIFFALVMAALLGLAWRFFDRALDTPPISAEVLAASPLLTRLAGWRLNGWAALGGMAMLATLFSAWALRAESLYAPMPRQIDLPQVKGWSRVDYTPTIWWQPRLEGADHRLIGRYADRAGHTVDVVYGLYSTQVEGREAGGFGEGALVPNTDWRWLEPGPAFPDGKSDLLFAQGRVVRLAVTWYRTDDVLTGSNTHLKLANMRDKLLMRAAPTMTLILSAEDRPDMPAAQSIAAFRNAIGPTGRWMDAIAQTR